MIKNFNETLNETTITHTFENGLTLVILNKKQNISTSVYMAFPYGSLNLAQKNKEGKISRFNPGLAHFLEHKLFENANGIDVMERFSELSCNVNAFTSYNETVYYFNTTNKDVKEPLELLMDFVQDFSITDASVEKEKQIIIQELRMYHQMPEARLMYETFQALYHYHPVKFDIGGSEESVLAITKNELDLCYKLNYHPKNTLMVIVSSIEAQQLIDIIENNQKSKHFDVYTPLINVPVDEPLEVAVSEVKVPMDIQSSKMTYTLKLAPQLMSDRQRATLEWQLKIVLELLFSSLNPMYETWIQKGIIHDYFGYDVEINEDYWYVMIYGETENKEEFIGLINEGLHADIYPLLSFLKQLKRRYLSYAFRLLDDQDDYAIHFIRSYFSSMKLEDTIDIINQLNEDDLLRAMSLLDTSHKAIVMVTKAQTGKKDK